MTNAAPLPLIVKSQHKSEKAAKAAARKIPGAVIVHEPETTIFNERWLVAVPV